MDGINGQRLVNLTRDEFLSLWPQLVGEVPWEHVVHLKNTQAAAHSVTEVLFPHQNIIALCDAILTRYLNL